MKGSAVNWQVAANLAEADAALAAVAHRIATGAEVVAAHAAQQLHAATERAFGAKRDPRTGQPWAPAAERTSRQRGWRSLLVREGTLLAAVRSGYGRTPGGARAFISFDDSQAKVAAVMTYGVRARTRRSNRTTRKRPTRAMPGRRLIGLDDQQFRDLVALAERELTPHAT